MVSPDGHPASPTAGPRVFEVTGLLEELIRIPSVNPRGRALPAETPLAERVAELCRSLGMRVRLDDVVDGRRNVVAELAGRSEEYILLETHLDTVETEGMTVPPFEPTREGHRIHGRGACDAKGSLAAFLSAVSTVAVESVAGRSPERGIVLVGAVDEEHLYRGVSDVIERGILRTPDARIVGAVVGEPTELSLVVAHKGCMRCRIVAHGPGGHSSLPWDVPNPIETLAEVVLHLRRVAEDLRGRPSPLVGPPSLAVTLVDGGSGPNVLPESAQITIDRRTVAGEEPHEVWEELKRDLEARWPGLIEVQPPHVVDFALDSSGESSFVGLVQRHLSAAGLDPAGVGVGHGTDGSKLARAGIPSVVFGPGSMAQAHTPAEYIDIAQLQQATAVLIQLLTGEPA